MLHPHPLTAFAVSIDGKMLATGSEDGDFADGNEPIVLWDVAAARPLFSHVVMGGVDYGGDPYDGLQFSSSGRLLGFNFYCDHIGVLDVASRRQTLAAFGWGVDHAPVVVISDDEREVFVGGIYSGDSPAGALIDVTAGDVSDGDAAMRYLDGQRRSSRGIAVRDGLVHVLHRDSRDRDDARLVSIERKSGAVMRSVTLTGNWPYRASPSRRLLAVGGKSGSAAGSGVELVDVDAGRQLWHEPLLPVNAFVFDRSETKLASLFYSPPKDGISLFENGKRTGFIGGPIATNWEFSTAIPFAFSPDGREGIVLRSAGVLERWSTDGGVRLLGPLPNTVPEAAGVAWPLADVAIAIGPHVVSFLHMPDGRVIASHRFP